MNDELAALLRAVRETPDDDAPRLVIADWLDEHGDSARAELLRIQCHPDFDWCGSEIDLLTRASALVAKHAKGWWGPDADGVRVTPTFGLLHVEVPLDRLVRDDLSPSLLDAWQTGWVDSLAITEAAVTGNPWALLVDSPRLAGVRELSIPWLDLDDEAASVLARSPHLGSLQGMRVGSCHLTPDGEATLLELLNLCRLTPLGLMSDGLALDLRFRQALRTGVLRLSNLPLSSPTELATLAWVVSPIIEVQAVDTAIHTDCLRDILALSTLRRLWLGHNRLALDAARIIAEQASPTLRHLDLANNRLDNASVAALAGSAYLAGLRLLDLAGNPFDHQGVAGLARSPHFARLRFLDVRDARLTAETVGVLCRPETFPSIRHIVLSSEALSPELRQRLLNRFGSALAFPHDFLSSWSIAPEDAL